MNKTKIYLLLTLALLMIAVITVWWGVWGMNKLFIEIWDWQVPDVNHITLQNLPVEAQIRRVFGKDAEMAIAIARAESGLRCDAQSRTSDSGLFQINKVHEWRGWTEEQMHDCTENIKMAKLLFDEQGWGIWTAYDNQSYKKFLN